jgi:hypothetical protein
MRLIDLSLGINSESLKFGTIALMWCVEIGDYWIVWLQYNWQAIFKGSKSMEIVEN